MEKSRRSAGVNFNKHFGEDEERRRIKKKTKKESKQTAMVNGIKMELGMNEKRSVRRK